MAESKLKPPEFDTNGFFRATFYRSLEFSLTTDTQKTTQKIVDLIRATPQITRQGMADLIGISPNGIKYHLNQLQKKGVVRRIGPDKSGYWEVVKDMSEGKVQ